jgi:hypothetical protein
MEGKSIMLKCTLKKQDMVYGMDSSGSGYGPMTGCCVLGKETSGFIKVEGVTDLMSDC